MASEQPESPAAADQQQETNRGSAGRRRWRNQADWLRHQNLPTDELQKIRDEAYSLWNTRPQKPRSSYNDHFFWKDVAGNARPNSAPLDQPYRNRPHPKVEFLVTRLHALPGYFDQQDGSASEQLPVSASAKPTVKIGRSAAYTTAAELQLQKLYAEAKAPHAVQWEPSLYRYMKIAGQEERDRINAAIDKARSGAVQRAQQAAFGRRYQFPSTTLTSSLSVGKECELVGSGYGFRPQEKSQTVYGFNKDFSIHPDWPPTLNHHAVP